MCSTLDFHKRTIIIEKGPTNPIKISRKINIKNTMKNQYVLKNNKRNQNKGLTIKKIIINVP